MAIYFFIVKAEPTFIWWWLHRELLLNAQCCARRFKAILQTNPSGHDRLFVTERSRLTGTHVVVRSKRRLSLLWVVLFSPVGPFSFLAVTYLQYTTGIAEHEGQQ